MPPTPQLKDMQVLENRVARSGTVLQVHVPDHAHPPQQSSVRLCREAALSCRLRLSGIPRERNRRPSDQAIELANDGQNAVQWSCPQRDSVLPHTVHNMWPSPVLLKPHLQGIQIMLQAEVE